MPLEPRHKKGADPHYDAYAAVQTPRGSNTPTVTLEDSWKADLSSPLDRAGWLSKCTLWWVNPSIRRGYAKTLQEDDVWELPVGDKATVLQDRFDKHYAESLRRHTKSSTDPTSAPLIYRALWNSTKDKMDLAIVLHFISSFATLPQPLVIKALLQFLQGNDNFFGIKSGYGLAALLTAAACVSVTTVDYAMYLTVRSGINARMIAVNSVYQKLLRLPSTVRLTMNSGTSSPWPEPIAIDSSRRMPSACGQSCRRRSSWSPASLSDSS
jgi:hypothetical protein